MPIISPKYITISFLFLCFGAFAQNLSFSANSAASYGIGEATTTWNDVHASTQNPAGITGVENLGFYFSAANLYNIGSLNLLSVGGVKRIKKHQAVSVSLQYSGDSDLNQQIYGVGYARKLNKNWSLGIRGYGILFRSAAYGAGFIPSLSLGSQFQANKNLDIGIEVFNPFIQSVTPTEDLTAIFRLGGRYRISSKVNMLAEVMKGLNTPYIIKGGMEYFPAEQLAIRTGFQSTGTFHLGLSYQWQKLGFHGSSSLHGALGITSAAEISYQK